MWNFFNCFLSGRHDFGMWCEPGAIFLRCVHCGRRSSGWALDGKQHTAVTAPQRQTPPPLQTTASARVVPFERAAAR